uniref:DNA topoisomerase 1 n=1 Tax=Steinernema glaseri TaxID=37863 RepID=A0A1I7ZUY2_9BILA
MVNWAFHGMYRNFAKFTQGVHPLGHMAISQNSALILTTYLLFRSPPRQSIRSSPYLAVLGRSIERFAQIYCESLLALDRGETIPKPPPGHKWKEVRHDNTVSWLCSWTENVLGLNKYMMFNPSSKIKGEKDYEKFETARKLKSKVAHIREQYTADWKSKEMRIRQRAVALYFIDKLALRAGNEKDDDTADTVGCCSLRCEHVQLHEEHNGKPFVVSFDFLGKDSIRYQNDQLDLLTKQGDSIHDKILAYNRANRQVAILCNHQRAVPKTHEKSMENLQNKIKDKKKELKDVKEQYDKAKGNAKDREKLKKRYERVKEQLKKLKIQRTDKDENKQIALGTSKLNYLDPRITVAWCKKHEVPLEKIFSKTHREKFRWAIDMADENYVF